MVWAASGGAQIVGGICHGDSFAAHTLFFLVHRLLVAYAMGIHSPPTHRLVANHTF